MADKLAQLQRLMEEGYEMVAVDSDDDCVEATLRRGARVAVVRLHRSDAERLLFAHPARALHRA